MPFKRKFKKTIDKKQSRAIAKLQKQVTNTEVRFTQLNNLGAVIPASFATWYTPAAMVKGTANGTRLGDKIRVIGFDWIGKLQNIDTSNGYRDFRMVVVIDTVTGGVAPTISEIFTDVSSAARCTFANYNLDLVSYRGSCAPDNTGKAYRILADKSGTLGPLTGANAANGTGEVAGHNAATAYKGADPVSTKRYHIRRKCNLVINYNANAGTIADIIQNNIAYSLTCTSGAGIEDSSAFTMYYLNLQ